jgi:SAM-dependent methyltransferase
MLDVARRQYIGVRFDHGDAEALPYHDAAFDVVISHFGVHHVPRPIMALSEARRVLRPGGRVAFTIWAPRTENIAMKLVHDAIARHGDPALSTAPALGISLTVPDHCVAALRDAGFSDVRADVVGRIWHHPNAHSLVNALKTGTARMGARLSAQSTASLSAMLAEVEAAAAQYRDRDGIAVPMAAIVAAGTKLRPLA